jgi:hypothetical protein
LTDPPPHVVEQSLCGTLLLAVAVSDLARFRRTGDRPLARSAARMIALAERFRFRHHFQPTMSGAAARADAVRADRAAYEEAVRTCAGLDRAGMRAAGLVLLDERPPGEVLDMAGADRVPADPRVSAAAGRDLPGGEPSGPRC